MWISVTNTRLELPPRAALRLCPASGATLKVLAGTVWLTIDHDRRDLVLGPGDSHVLSGPQPLLAMALGQPAACVELRQPAAPQRSPTRAAVASSSANSALMARPGTA
jgi:hypothetical protein